MTTWEPRRPVVRPSQGSFLYAPPQGSLPALRRRHPGLGGVPAAALLGDTGVSRLARVADAAGHILVGLWPPSATEPSSLLVGAGDRMPGLHRLLHDARANGWTSEVVSWEDLLREGPACPSCARLARRQVPHACLLPWRIPGVPVAQYRRRLRDAAWPGARRNGRPLILLADDDPDLLELLKQVLENAGCEVRTASDGAEALELGLALRPDLALLNHLMPRMTGVEACRGLRADPGCRWVKIVVFSASPVESSARMAGADGFLQTPFNVREVVDLVSNVVSG